jgi:imidazolonepropionase-like amidohydrolase
MATTDPPNQELTRRRFLVWSGASAAAAVLAACEFTDRTPPPGSAAPPGPSSPATVAPTATPSAAATASATPTLLPSPSASADPAAARRTLYRNGALADARSDRLDVGVSILVEDGVIRWIRPRDGEEDPGPRDGLERVDASGATFVAGMVDAHSHVTLPGGAHWVDRGGDDPAVLLDVAERNGRLLTSAGIRWARDAGAPFVDDPSTGRRQALSLGIRDRWQERPTFPYIRAAGTWLTKRGSLPNALRRREADNADELVALAREQLDHGADLLKLYLDGPEAGVSPWSSNEIARVVELAHGRGVTVTAHCGSLSAARAGVRGGIDAVEHGYVLDAAIAAEMAERRTFLVSTLAVHRSWQTFRRTASPPPISAAFIRDRLARAQESIRIARRAGVRIAAGSDFGGGSLRANQLAWEVEELVDAGLEPWQALAAATWRGGEILGEPDAGTIREGGPADFFLVHGDPLSDPASLWRVWRVAWAE